MKSLVNVLSFIAFALLVLAGGLQAQTRKELEQKKSKLRQDIQYKNKLLKETQQTKKSTLNSLLILNKKIQEREELIATIKREISIIDQKISENEALIRTMQDDIKRLKEEYAEMIRFAYKTRNKSDKLMFVFAASDFNQAYKRLKYFQQYSDYRKRQTAAIMRMEKELEERNAQLLAQRKLKEELLGNESQERLQLSREKGDQQTLVASLQTKEKELRADIRDKEKERRILQKAIERIIAEEIRKASKAGTKKGVFELTPEAKALAANFTANKGKLPWPVEKGVVVSAYGVHAHEVVRSVKVKNNGLTISTQAGGVARAVFEGEVTGVIKIEGAGKAVMVRHGNFFTVYGNLNEVFVQRGDRVTTKESLGVIRTANNKTELQFELWQDSAPTNPQYWLFKGT